MLRREYNTTFAPSDAVGIVVGDVSAGVEWALDFIRGNVEVRIRGINSNSVVEAAQAIDSEIIRALEKAAK